MVELIVLIRSGLLQHTHKRKKSSNLRKNKSRSNNQQKENQVHSRS